MSAPGWTPEAFARWCALPAGHPDRAGAGRHPAFDAWLRMLAAFEDPRDALVGRAELAEAVDHLSARLEGALLAPAHANPVSPSETGTRNLS